MVSPNTSQGMIRPNRSPSVIVTPPPITNDPIINQTADYVAHDGAHTATVSPNTSGLNFSSLLLQVNASLSQK
jgi:hypothetical protein